MTHTQKIVRIVVGVADDDDDDDDDVDEDDEFDGRFMMVSVWI